MLRYSWYRPLDYFIPPALLDDWVMKTRARVLVGVLLMNAAVSLLDIAVILWTRFSTSYAPILLWHALGTLLVESICLVLLRESRIFALISHLFTGFVYASLLAVVVLTGGFAQSPFLVVFIVVPVYIFILGGIRSGLAWAALTAVTIAAFYAADRAAVEFPQILAAEMLPRERLRAWMITCTIVIGCLIIYETLNTKLRSLLQFQRNQFAYQANHDLLTALPNRALFAQRLQEAVHDTQSRGLRSALLYIDIDGFKPVNDWHGHHAGDQLLQTLAERLRREVRTRDTVARLGGDEFAVILHDIHDETTLTLVLDKLLNSLAEPVQCGGATFSVSASIGVALIPDHGIDPDELCQRADKAMYQAKRSRNTFSFYQANSMRTA